MKRFVCLIACAALVCAGTANGDIGTAVTIHFDDQPAPYAFSSSVHLGEQYSALGVHFSGPDPVSGGSVLNQSSNFGIPARSGANFLAFNSEASNSEGGTPKGPETIVFDNTVRIVTIYAGGGTSTDSFQMSAFDAGGNLLATSAGASSSSYIPLQVMTAGASIKKVVLAVTNPPPQYYVYDDLTFDVPEPACLSVPMVGLFLLGRRRWGGRKA